MAADVAVAPGSGVALSAFDSFVLERLAGGWKPSIFVRDLRSQLERAHKVD